MKYLIICSVFFFTSNSLSAQTSSQDTSAKSALDSSDLYGLVPQKPIKVGGDYIDGVAKQKKYLESLRDVKGKSVSYERKGSCCSYPSENGFNGHALLDMYEVTYRDADNKKQKVVLYISFYDYEEPKPVKGFTMAR